MLVLVNSEILVQVIRLIPEVPLQDIVEDRPSVVEECLQLTQRE